MIVVKIGGSVICKDPSRAIEDLAKYAGEAVAVHGGGCAVNELMRALGIQPKFLTHPGGVVSRYTDGETLRAFVMAMSWINKTLVASLIAKGVIAVGLTGADGLVVKAKRKERVLVVDERGRQRVVDGGYSGKIVDVDVKALAPPPLKVLAPIAVSEKGELLNVDGDQIAFEVATRLGAKLVILSDVDGLIIGGRVVERLTPDEAEELAKTEEVKGGMKRKLLAAAEAARRGVETVIYNGLVESPVTKALSGAGTHIVPK